MAFTQRTITHTVKNADGTSGSGSIIFTLSKRMTNGANTILPAPVIGTLDASGNLSVTLYSNADAGTVPPDAQYRVDFRLSYAGSSEETFFIQVPAGPGTTDLGSLLPGAEVGGG